ncbi:Di-copper centre-containing protein, partial [Conidiobolus coronatus NRRL 28638]
MKIHLSIYLVYLFNRTVAQSGCPKGIRVRPNYLTMPKAARDKFHNAIKVLNSSKGNNYYSKFSDLHNYVGDKVHGTPQFFVWHRRFIREFEKLLQKIDPTIMLPYWDWTQDSQAPEKSKIFAISNMGPNGGGGKGGCIDSGTFSGWKVPTDNPECVSRFFAGGETIPAWTAPEIMDNDLNSNVRYVDIWDVVESTSHALVHTGIGGEDGDMSYLVSPNDPIFYIHHGFVDYIYWEWQLRHPKAANDYPTDPNTTMLELFNSTVASTMSTKSSGYCYTYPKRWTVGAPKIDSTTPPKEVLKAGSIQSQEPSNSESSLGIPIPPTPPEPSAVLIERRINKATSLNLESTTHSLESCPKGELGLMLGCRKSRRALDLHSLLPRIIHFQGFVSPNDRATRNKIRVPARVPEFYIKNNHINPVKALENYLKAAIVA